MWARIRYEFASSKFALLVGMIVATGTAAVLYIGARQVQAGAITVGDLILVMSYMSQLYSPVKSKKGEVVYPGRMPGVEAGWAARIPSRGSRPRRR